jgi:CRP/FNR family transcriptional regulator, nitrogen fixation regulation protein
MSMTYTAPARPSATANRGSREQLEVEGARRTFARDAEIFGEGEDPAWVYQVVSGAVRTFRVLSDGRRQIEAFHFAGDCFGLEAGLERRTTAEALTETVVKVVKRSALTERALDDADVARRLWRLTAQDLRRMQDHVLMLGRRSATERVAGFLLDLAERSATPGVVDLPMSRQDIADYLGLTIETVSRTFTQLQGAGSLHLSTSRHVVLADREALLEMCA